MLFVKVPCDVVFTIKLTSGGKALKQQDVFEVSPGRAQIAAQGHLYAVVTFSPSAMQVLSSGHLSFSDCLQILQLFRIHLSVTF